MPPTTALGWCWSANNQEWQLARIADEDRLIHLYVIGATGCGKTKFLEHLIRQDIEAGRGCAVIDPHGDLIEALKGQLAVLGRTRGEAFLRERIVLMDLGDPRHTVSFNPIERIAGVDPGDQAAELIASFKKIWADSWGVRMEDLLRNSLLALSAAGGSLAELPAFLTDPKTRQAILAHLTHPIALAYFDRFQRLTDRAQLTWSEPVLNKINALLANDRVRDLLSAPTSTFNPREVMDSGKILLIKLDKGRLKESADLLGSLLLAKLQLAVFSRSDLPYDQRRPFYLYVDEFQNFATASFGVLLSEARKYGLSLTLAHQTLAQIPEELQSLILGNAGIHVVFRVNRRDAERLAKEAFAYSGYRVKSATLHRLNYWSLGEEWERYTEELQNQPPRSAWVKHKIQGGLIPIKTVEIAAPWDELGLARGAYEPFIAGLPIGAAYLRPRGAADQFADRPRGSAPGRPDHGGVQPAAAPQSLTDDEAAFLRLVIAEPETPVSGLYQRFGASNWKGAELRRALTAKGYLIELDTRLGKAGRAATFLLPAFPALERFALAPLPGRGGALHRHAQRLVAAEAEAKGWSARLEQPLPDGNAVDVHIDAGNRTIAVEIAIWSRLAREIEHIDACLTAGYATIICVVWSERLRLDLLETLPIRFPAVDPAWVAILPLTRISRLLTGEGGIVPGEKRP